MIYIQIYLTIGIFTMIWLIYDSKKFNISVKNKVILFTILIWPILWYLLISDYIKILKTRKISIEEKISWSEEYLKNELGKNFHIIKPRMPLQDNAKYSEWKIHFERHFPYLKNNLILTVFVDANLHGKGIGSKFIDKNRAWLSAQ